MDSIKTEIVIVGAGPGGYAAAFYAADLGKKVILIEREKRLGGVCLNRGCIPSKALLYATHQIVNARESERLLKAAKKGDGASSELHLEAGNRLLASTGQLGRDFLNLVLEAGDWDEDRAFSEPSEPNLLQHIQADLFHLRDRGQEDCPRLAVSTTDDSLRVHSCHSPLREVEVLYDHLLDWFARDPKLAPRDVLVMTPDVETYAPFIQAVFDAPEDAGKRIPFSVADRGIRATSQIIAAFFNLLSLPATRLEATSVLRLLEAETVRTKFGLSESDLDTIRVWIRRTNIRWGQDAQQRESLGLPALPENTWRQGMDRLLLGYAMAGRGERMFNKVLPFDDVEGANAAVLGHFAEYLQRLFDASLNTPQVVEKRLIYMTPEWKDAFRYAATLADQLGLEMAIAGSPGWSESGGPWVPPSQAMKKYVWSETVVEGGKPFSGTLAKPPSTTGPFQNIPGSRGGAGVYWRNVLEQEVSKVKARGIVLYGVIGCSFQSIDKEMWRSYFHEKGIPSINLEGSFQTGAPTGQLMTRVKAFIEMLS